MHQAIQTPPRDRAREFEAAGVVLHFDDELTLFDRWTDGELTCTRLDGVRRENRHCPLHLATRQWRQEHGAGLVGGHVSQLDAVALRHPEIGLDDLAKARRSTLEDALDLADAKTVIQLVERPLKGIGTDKAVLNAQR